MGIRESFKDLILGIFFVDDKGNILKGALPKGWSKEEVSLNLLPSLYISKGLMSPPFLDITETDKETIVVITLEGKIYGVVVGRKGEAPLGVLLRALKEMFSENYPQLYPYLEKEVKIWERRLT